MPPQNENTREALLRGCRGCLQAGREAEQDQAGESCTVDSESTTRRVYCPSRSPSSRALAASHSLAPSSPFLAMRSLYSGTISASSSCSERRRSSTWRISVFWSRSEEHTSELQSLMRTPYAVFC